MTDTPTTKPITFTIERLGKMLGSDMGKNLWFFSDSENRSFVTDAAGVTVKCSKKEDSYSFDYASLPYAPTPTISQEDAAALNTILRDAITKAAFVNATPQDVLAAFDAIADKNNPMSHATFEVQGASPSEIVCTNLTSPPLKKLAPKGNKHAK